MAREVQALVGERMDQEAITGARLLATEGDHMGEVGTFTGKFSSGGSMIELRFEDGVRAWKLRRSVEPC